MKSEQMKCKHHFYIKKKEKYHCEHDSNGKHKIYIQSQCILYTLTNTYFIQFVIRI